MNWNEYYASQLMTIASKSPDPSSKYAAIIVDSDNLVVSTGYNGLPKGIRKEVGRMPREVKYRFIVHAEVNAVCNAAVTGRSTRDCFIYLIKPPCMECAKIIIQAQIRTIVCVQMHSAVEFENFPDRSWRDSIIEAGQTLIEAGIPMEILS